MEIIEGKKTQVLKADETVVTVGKFDGLHLGHQKIFRTLLEEKKKTGRPAVVFTFSSSPYERLGTGRQKRIISETQKRRRLEDMGIDYLVECPFSDKIMKMSPQQFVDEFVLRRMHAKAVCVGNDFRFGYHRAGDPEFLRAYGEEKDYTVQVLDKEYYKGEAISSTRIRECLLKGQIEEVNTMLGYHYGFIGEVMHGRQMGRVMNMPTINQFPEQDVILPPFGVYASKVLIPDGSIWTGVTNIGIRPTFRENNDQNVITAETHLIGFDGDLYGQVADVELLKMLRPEKRFSSVEELKVQMRKDMENAGLFAET
ncbi:MAG: bifunctional riboflavin kinase/FAD synthetase [Lachnospiraceae bacterium]|nr:bifunctional riboflavin kinase/FAD synthetase [Lachnospiraceae bacterium]